MEDFMHRRQTKVKVGAKIGFIAALVGTAILGLSVPAGQAQDVTLDMAARYILETVKAFRTAYVINIVERVKESGVQSKEEWIKDAHAIPLPAQFVKAAGADISSFEIGLIGLTPVYKSNLPKTQAETDALTQLATDRQLSVLTFADGKQFKGVSADIAIVQSCVDCHNNHPNSPWRNFKKGDLMGAIVVRLNRPVK
ncbi:MAG: DUF3365 domain-containing protein [Nitrospira sp.]|nr:DUF3365 domain-containing protein [Nitrospira sp.]